jgi:hypothetical protein
VLIRGALNRRASGRHLSALMEAQLPACRAVAHPQRAAQRAGFSAHAVGEEDDILSKSHRCERPSSTGGRWVRHQSIDDLLPIPDATRGAELLEVPVQQHLYLIAVGTDVRPEEQPFEVDNGRCLAFVVGHTYRVVAAAPCTNRRPLELGTVINICCRGQKDVTTAIPGSRPTVARASPASSSPSSRVTSRSGRSRPASIRDSIAG